MILRFHLPTLWIVLWAAAAPSAAYLPSHRPRFTAGVPSSSATPFESVSSASLYEEEILRRRRRLGLLLHAIADETESVLRPSAPPAVAAGLAQAEKAAEAALAAKRRAASSDSAVAEEERRQSPGFVGFRPIRRESTATTNIDIDPSRDRGLDETAEPPSRQRPMVTVRPGPGVTITSASGNVVVGSALENDEDSVDPQKQQQQPAANESNSEEDSTEEGSDEAAAARAAATAALLRRKVTGNASGRPKSGTSKGRTQTSVGSLKTGSARRSGGSVAGRLLGTVRTAAAAAAARRKKENESSNDSENDAKMSAVMEEAAKQIVNRMSSTTKQSIQSTVEDVMQNQERNRRANAKEDFYKAQTSAMGLFGEPLNPSSVAQLQGLSQQQQGAYDAQYINERAFHNYISRWEPPAMGSILVHPQANSFRRFGAYSNNLGDVKHHIGVRVATPWDDIDIANLRLSVFSNIAADLRNKFCQKSCEVLDNRRNKGATCLVAAIDRSMRDSIVERNTFQDGADFGNLIQPRDSDGSQWFMGSVECSVHEFYDTALGQCRPAGKVLYVTEVAVLPEARRTGAATRLMLGVDELATSKGIESLYLHVDVNNKAAITLYEKSGYSIISKEEHPMFEEFTTRLNLHDGATNGRNHYLMYKHLTDSPTWIEDALPDVQQLKAEIAARQAHSNTRRQNNNNNNQGSLGFEVPIQQSGGRSY